MKKLKLDHERTFLCRLKSLFSMHFTCRHLSHERPFIPGKLPLRDCSVIEAGRGETNSKEDLNLLKYLFRAANIFIEWAFFRA